MLAAHHQRPPAVAAPSASSTSCAATPVAHICSSRRVKAAAAGPSISDVFVLDFDGVLVDSEPEVSTSAFAAASTRWPQLFAGLADSSGSNSSSKQRDELMAGLRQTRPVLVRGYESMVMARLLLEEGPSCAEAILRDWEPLLQSSLARWGEDWLELQALFESQRAAWLASDRQGWLSLNRPYPGMVDALQSCQQPVYFASSKAAKRVCTLLQEHFGVADATPDSPRLFASLIPPEEKKAAALKSIAERPLCRDTPGVRLHFVDDRLDTLLAVQRQGDCGPWQLYLADWGYCTAEERATAAATPGIRVLARGEFTELLKWGLAMGVDDGCEPTAEEVAAGV